MRTAVLVCVYVYVYGSCYFEYQLLNKDEDLENLSSKSFWSPMGSWATQNHLWLGHLAGFPWGVVTQKFLLVT